MEIRPLAAKVTANGNGNKTTIENAQTVYVCATADDLITNVTTCLLYTSDAADEP